MTKHYETLTGRRLEITSLGEAERAAYARMVEAYEAAEDWSEFSNQWQNELKDALPSMTAKERAASILYRIGQDLELRLGVEQGEVAPPDYRDYIVDRIEEKFGSRYKFCKTADIPEAFLSQVLSGSKNFSIDMLRRVAEVLDLGLVLLPLTELARMPASDLAAMQRVSSLLNEELSTLQTIYEHVRRIKDPEKRHRALRNERELVPGVLDRIWDELERRADEKAAKEALRPLKEEADRVESFLETVRARIAAAAEPSRGKGLTARRKIGASTTLSRV